MTSQRAMNSTDLVRGFRDGVRGLDVVQDPRAAALRDELPAENLPTKHQAKSRQKGPERLTRSSARYMLAVKMSAPAPCCGHVEYGAHSRIRHVNAHHLLSEEVLLERALSRLVVLECNVAIRREGTRQDRDVTKD